MRRYVEKFHPSIAGWVFRILFWAWSAVFIVMLVGYATNPAVRLEMPATAFWLAIAMWAIGAAILNGLYRMAGGRKEIIEVE